MQAAAGIGRISGLQNSEAITEGPIGAAVGFAD
jgi:hypothetical protein